MHKLYILLVVMLCSSCAQLPRVDIPQADPKKAPAVVFDIDGTLTPTVLSVFTAREDAAEVARTFAQKGYKIFYLSTRVSWLSAGIPDWLKQNGFPYLPDSVHVAQEDEDRSHPYDFKKRKLLEFYGRDWEVKFAYGDSSTDFAAYAAVGIPKTQVFALLRDRETWCEWGDWNECLYGWTKHLEFVRKLDPYLPSK